MSTKQQKKSLSVNQMDITTPGGEMETDDMSQPLMTETETKKRRKLNPKTYKCLMIVLPIVAISGLCGLLFMDIAMKTYTADCNAPDVSANIQSTCDWNGVTITGNYNNGTSYELDSKYHYSDLCHDRNINNACQLNLSGKLWMFSTVIGSVLCLVGIFMEVLYLLKVIKRCIDFNMKLAGIIFAITAVLTTVSNLYLTIFSSVNKSICLDQKWNGFLKDLQTNCTHGSLARGSSSGTIFMFGILAGGVLAASACFVLCAKKEKIYSQEYNEDVTPNLMT